jgi:type I restriction enzyme S subunit
MGSGTTVQAGKRAIYPAYKPSGVVWLGHVPEHWEVKRAKGLLARNDGGVWGEDFDDDGVIVLRSTEQTVDGEWKIVEPAKRRLTSTEYGSCRLKEGDLVVTKSSGSSLHIGKTSIVTKEVEALNCCYSNFMQRLRVKRTAEPRFVWYVLNGELGRKQFDYYSSTTTGLANLNGSIIGNVGMAVPPLDEQKAIASFLDRETARIDALIEKKRRQIELLQEKRSALISHAVTKGLDLNAPMKDSGIEWLGHIPAHWQVLPIKRVARMDSGHTPDKKVEEYWKDCTIPWVSLNDTGYLKEHDYIDDTTHHVNELGLANSSAHLLPERVVLFTRDATIGLSAITTRPMAVSQHIIAWICGPRIIPEYLLRMFYSMTQELERLCMGSTIRTLGMPDVLELVTPLPPVEEQQVIVRQLETEIPKLVALVAKVEESIRVLIEHRAALISAAVTGKIDVREEVDLG